jgi:hypothetical protein
MRKTTSILAATCLAAAAAAACEDEGTISYDGLSSFRVTVTSGDTGTAQNRIPVAASGVAFEIEVQAVDGYGSPLAWTGQVALSAVPGELGDTADDTMQVAAGKGTASILVERAFGPTRVWVEDIGTSDRPGTYATGLTDTIWLDGLRIRNIQQSDSTLRSPFEGERPVIRDGTMVVTRVSADGFYVTDVDAYLASGEIRDTEWASVFAFNYSVPEGLERGDVLTRLEGGVTEFYGLTELSFPVWEVGGSREVPPPVPLDCDDDVASSDSLDMERWESALVEVTGATVIVCPQFPTCPDLNQYGQWSIRLPSPCSESVNVVSRVDLPTFSPADNQGRTLERLVGVLRQHQYASPQWIIEPRDENDICCPACTPQMQGGCL